MVKLYKAIVATALSAAIISTSCLTSFGANQYDGVSGTSTTFKKYLIVSAGDNIPNVTFNYTIAAGEAVSADTSNNEVFQVLPGVDADKITITATTFSDDDATYTATQTEDIDVGRAASSRATGLTAATGVEFETSKNEKYAKQVATIDFSHVTFDEPGIYRYIVTESANAANAAMGITNDNDVDRVLDVYVTDNGQGVLVVSSYVMHTEINDGETPAINSTMGTADVTTDGAALSDKTDGFTNEYHTKDLVFKKEVDGNEASRDKWFEFTATLADVNDADVFTVSLADDSNANTTDGNADATSGTTSATRESNRGKTNPTSVTGAQLKAGVKFYLQHGQSIAIRGIPVNATYTVTEDKEDYKSEASVVTGHTDATTGVIGTIAGDNKAVHTSYKNTRRGNVATGIVLNAAKFIGIGLVGIGVIFVLFLLKKKRDSEEELA